MLPDPDFALEELPGPRLHEVLRACREQGPVAPARFMDPRDMNHNGILASLGTRDTETDFPTLSECPP